MCPDRQILSLYLDGELPSPWREKLEAHLGSCGACRAQLEEYRRLRGVLTGAEPAIDAARSRVWARLGVDGPARRGTAWRRAPLWRRTVSLPAAAGAAAALAAAAFLLALNLRAPEKAAPPGSVVTGAVASSIGADVQGMSPATDMNGLLQYLSTQDTAGYTVINLPESRNFSSLGEPALLKAADYTSGGGGSPR